jgi:hypothetical protein
MVSAQSSEAAIAALAQPASVEQGTSKQCDHRDDNVTWLPEMSCAVSDMQRVAHPVSYTLVDYDALDT